MVHMQKAFLQYGPSNSSDNVGHFPVNLLVDLHVSLLVQHIYRADLDGTQQKRKPKKKNTMMTHGMKSSDEVRSNIALPIPILLRIVVEIFTCRHHQM